MEDLISRVSRELSTEMPISTNVFYNKDTIIVRPNLFIANNENCFSDYHFSIPSVTTPPIRIGKKEYNVKANRVLTLNPEESIIIKNSAGDLPTRGGGSIRVTRGKVNQVQPTYMKIGYMAQLIFAM